ncbi:hypothetical protein MKX53_18835 [Psychrobacillus sp. FSL K6-4615]|uniref:hypothetical protein n=1 Tax=Psychrobacillus sp. FSL K6-4615 TaxID=2921551 RepID=UPI0030F9E6BE
MENSLNRDWSYANIAGIKTRIELTLYFSRTHKECRLVSLTECFNKKGHQSKMSWEIHFPAHFSCAS